MLIELAVFRLRSRESEAVDSWLKELKAYLSHTLNGNIAITPREGDHPADALWIGAPFILAGRQEEIERFIRQLSAEARRILDDCAYYWILSDSDQYLLSPDRTITLNWEHKHFEIVASRLRLLLKYPRLAGLSLGMHKLRAEVERLAVGRKGPWASVLIIGESGTGKEEVAHSLYESINHEASGKDREAFTPIACGSFDKELLRSQLFGIGPGIATNVKGRPGLLERGSAGGVFLDDFDTALELIQGPLLRVMSAGDNKEAIFYRLGEENEKGKERRTRVWLIFSTNADIVTLIEEKKLREDFIFRFKDRIIPIPPLHERPADIPSIARHIWNKLDAKRPLSALALQQMFSHRTKWKGNVRALQALLSLAASMINLPSHNLHSQREIFGEIMARGDEYYHWVGIVSSASFTGPIPPGNSDLRAILKLDEGHYCVGLRKGQPDPAPTGSEREALSRLSPLGSAAFERALNEVKSRRESKNVVRPSVRLARIIAYVARRNDIDRHICVDLSSIGDVTAVRDLRLLEKAGLLKVKSRKENDLAENRPKNLQVVVYENVPAMYN